MDETRSLEVQIQIGLEFTEDFSLVNIKVGITTLRLEPSVFPYITAVLLRYSRRGIHQYNNEYLSI